MKNNTMKRVLAGTLAVLTVAAYAPANVGGFLTGSTNAIVASAASGTITELNDSYKQTGGGTLNTNKETAPYIEGVYKMTWDAARNQYNKANVILTEESALTLQKDTKYVIRTTAKVTGEVTEGSSNVSKLDEQTTDLNNEQLPDGIYEYVIQPISSDAHLTIVAQTATLNFAGTYNNIVLTQRDEEIIINKDTQTFPIVVGYPAVLTVEPKGQQTAQNLAIESGHATFVSQTKDANGAVTFTFIPTEKDDTVKVNWVNYLPTLTLAYDRTSTNITATDIGFNNMVTDAPVGTYAFRYGVENGSSFTHSAMSGSNYVYEEEQATVAMDSSTTLKVYRVNTGVSYTYELVGVAPNGDQYVVEQDTSNKTKVAYKVKDNDSLSDSDKVILDDYTAVLVPKYYPNDAFAAKATSIDNTDYTYLNPTVTTTYYKQNYDGTYQAASLNANDVKLDSTTNEKSATFKAITTVTANPAVATLDKGSYTIETVFTLVRKGITNTSIEFYQSATYDAQGKVTPGTEVITGADGAYHINWTGKEITPFVRPNVSLGLEEGRDYYITGTTTATAPGTYEMQIVPTSDSYNNGKAITVKWAIDDNNRYVTRDNFEAEVTGPTEELNYELAPDFTLSYRKASTKAIEAEIRKQLDFVGSNDLTVVKYVDVTPETWEDPDTKNNKIRDAGNGYKVFNDGTQDTHQKEALDKAAEAAYKLNKAAEDLANYKGTTADDVAGYGNEALAAAKLVLQLNEETSNGVKDLSKGILHILKTNDALEPDDKDKDKGDVDAAEKALKAIYKAKEAYDTLTGGDKNVAEAKTYAAAAIAQAEKIVEIGTRLSGRYLATTLQVDETTTSGTTTGYAGFDDPSTAAGTYVALVANVVANDDKTSAMLHEGVKVELVPVVFEITRTNVEIVPTVTECTFGDDIKLSELYKVIDADTADEEVIGVPWYKEPSLSLRGVTSSGTTVKTSTKDLDAGTYTYDVTAELLDKKNYDLSTKKMTTFTVNPRSLDDMNFDTVRISTEDSRYNGSKTVRVTAADVVHAANKLENPAAFAVAYAPEDTNKIIPLSTTDLLIAGGYTSAKKTEVGKILEVNVLGTGNFTGSAKISWSVGGQTTDAAFATYEAEFDVAKPRIMSKLDLTQFEGEIVEAGFYYSNNGKLTGDPDSEEGQKALKTELLKADNGTDASKNPKNSKVVKFSETAVKKALAGNGVLTAEIANSSMLKQTYEMAYVKFANGEVAYDVVQKNNYYDMVMTAEGALEITKTDIIGTGTGDLKKDQTYVRVDVTRVNKEGYTVKRYGVAYNNNGYFGNDGTPTEQQDADAWLTLDHESEKKTVKIGELEADELATKRGVYVYFANSVDSTGKVGAKKGYAKAFIQIEDAAGNTGAYYSNLADVTYGGFVLDADGKNTVNVDSTKKTQIEFYGNGKYTNETIKATVGGTDGWQQLASATGTKPYAQWWEEKN